MGLLAKGSGSARGVDVLATGPGAANTANIAEDGAAAAAAKGAAPAAVGVARGVFGIAAGSALLLLARRRKAAVKIYRLTHGKGVEMLTADGERWKKIILDAETFKLAINTAKAAVAAVSIAGSALLLASNPIGWPVGLVAGIVGAAFAASKLIGKLLNARDKMNVYAAEDDLSEIGDPIGATRRTKDTGRNEDISLEAMGYDQSQVRAAGPQNEPDTGAGFSSESEGPDDDKTARIAAIEAANHVAALASKNAKTAAAIRVALSSGDAGQRCCDR